MEIWILVWNTESGDEGVSGYWDTKPTEAQLTKYIADRFPDDYEARTFYHVLKSLKKVGA